MERRRVGIVGAGISGLLACKYALAKGYHPIVFEAKDTLGGVWTKALETTKLQTPKQQFQFSDFPWPSSVEADFPPQTQVFDYIKSYANHFDLIKHIRFNSKVVSIKYEGASEEERESWALWGGNGEAFGIRGKWVLSLQDLISHSTQVMQVDFLILCIGRFSDVANMPEFALGKGPEVFQGKVMHAMDYAAMDNESARNLIKGKRVTVVGCKKSALDIAMQCSVANGVEHPCTVICRTPHWNLPDFSVWGIPLANLYFTRFAELLLHKPGQGPLLSLLATILSPLRWGMCKFVESDIKKKHPLKKFGVVPEHSFIQDVTTCSIPTVPEGFYDNAEKGSLILKRSQKAFSFCKEGIMLEFDNKHAKNGVKATSATEVIKSDVVILATGFRGDQKLKNIFESPTFQKYIIGSSNTVVPLYRECIHPRIPQLGVIGFSEGLSNLFTSELRSRWMMELLDDKFKLPSIHKMEEDVMKWDQFMKRYCGKQFRKACLGLIHIWYSDQLCRDMGWNPKRKKGFWAELFEPYGPTDYVSP